MEHIKENLFKLIRDEKVLVFAGAGMSISAGFPSGNKLSQIVYSNLTESEQKIINPNLNLQDLTEEFCRIKLNSRVPLTNILNEIFLEKRPSKIHEDLASIPHIKTILTTNYDQLFENAYGNKAQVNYLPIHIPYIDSKKNSNFQTSW